MTNKIKQKTVVSQIMDHIRHLIVTKEIKSGDRLPTESELAEQFGTGRSSVREAIKIFNYLGVMESSPSRGTYLCDGSHISQEAVIWSVLLGENDYQDIIETRGAIEVWAILCLQNHLRDDFFYSRIEKMEQSLLAMKDALEKNDIHAAKQADYAFHSHVISCADNSIFERLFSTLETFMMEEIDIVYQEYTDFTTLLPNHQEILDAIKSCDIPLAITLCRSHITETLNSMDSVRRRHAQENLKKSEH